MTLYSANQAFTFTGKDGVPRPFNKGVLMDDSDPDFKGRESLFEPVEVAAARPAKQASGLGGVEEATAEPNAKRSVSTVRHEKPQHEKSEPEPKEDKPTK